TDDTAAIQIGARVDGAIAHAGQVDRYTFSLAQRTRLYFDSLTDSQVFWTLAGPTGTLVAGRNLRTSDSADNYPLLDLVTGNYTLTFDASGDDVVAYAFRLTDTASATPITPGVASGLDPRWTQGQLGGGLFLDGLSSVQVPQGPAVDQRNNLTVELWFKADRFGSPWSNLLYKGDGPGARTYALYLNSAG